MIRIRQHVPGYINDGEGARVIEVADQAALLSVPWIASYRHGDLVAKQGEVRIKPFHQFSLDGNALMVEYDDGHSWRVLAFIEAGREALSLPRWIMHPEAQQGIDEWNKGNTAYDDGRFKHWPLASTAKA